MSESLYKGLLAVNCHYNHKVESNGRCYSRTCMLNQDPEFIKDRERKEGCVIYKSIKEVGGHYELV